MLDKVRGKPKDFAPPLKPEPKFSERFAHDVQMVEALERDLADARAYAQEQENRAMRAEDQLAKTEEKLAQMETKRDYFMQRFIETNTKLRTAATTVYDCIRESQKDMEEIDKTNDPYKPKPEAERAIARAVARTDEDEPQPQLPNFVKRPVETHHEA